MLPQTIAAGRKSGAIDAGSVTRVAVDATVTEKTIANRPMPGFSGGRGRN